MPTLMLGEGYFCTDTFEFFVGNSSNGNCPLNNPVYNTSGTIQKKCHIVIGTATLSGGGTATITLSGSAVFTNSTSYRVVVTCTNAKHAPQVVQTSGSQFTINGAGSDAVQFIAIGN